MFICTLIYLKLVYVRMCLNTINVLFSSAVLKVLIKHGRPRSAISICSFRVAALSVFCIFIYLINDQFTNFLLFFSFYHNLIQFLSLSNLRSKNKKEYFVCCGSSEVTTKVVLIAIAHYCTNIRKDWIFIKNKIKPYLSITPYTKNIKKTFLIVAVK